ADAVLGSGEAALTELTDAELADLVELRGPGTSHIGPAPCPRALLRLLLPAPRPHHPTPPSAGGHGQGLVQFVMAAHEGQRNTRLFWAACRAYEDGIGPGLVEPLVEAALDTGLTEREARATIASAARLTGHHP
ncbi:hypothetical protein ACWEGM_29830, partial [Streptomyces nigra]